MHGGVNSILVYSNQAVLIIPYEGIASASTRIRYTFLGYTLSDTQLRVMAVISIAMVMVAFAITLVVTKRRGWGPTKHAEIFRDSTWTSAPRSILEASQLDDETTTSGSQ